MRYNQTRKGHVMSYEMKTTRGYALDEAASALQKAIRRGDAEVAGYFAQELTASGYAKYVWRRLLIISAEDCAGCITQEIKALHDSWEHINKSTAKAKRKNTTGRVFISKAVVLMVKAGKCRDADHLSVLLYDRNEITDAECENHHGEKRLKIPEYALDCHTKRGRFAGRTKDQFFHDEFEALEPRQLGLFDHLVS